MVLKLLPIVLLGLLVGCGHSRASKSNSMTSRTSCYHAETELDGAMPQSPDNDRTIRGKAFDGQNHGRKLRHAILLRTLDLAGESLAASAVDRRMRPGAHHDRNDRVEAILYAMLIRLGMQTLRDVTSGLLEDE